MKPTLGTAAGRALAIDLDALVRSRMLLTANSGAGKSWALRRLLEQTHGRIQQLVIDPEGEFYTLRERFDLILAGKGGDCAAEPRSAALLARKLLELGTSAVLDLYELAPRDRVRFVRLFLEALIDAPRSLWHPALVVLDEAHAFAPESGHGQAESLEAVARLMSQGRKRGFAGVLATQRFSKLAKDVAAEANNLLIGRAALDVDLKRTADALGLAKSDWPKIRGLSPGHFFAFGQALSPEVVEVAVGPVETAHPKAGGRAAPPAPPRAKVQAVLAQLADLPAEAEAEARTADELRAQLRQRERELAEARRGSLDPDALEEARREGRASVAAEVVMIRRRAEAREDLVRRMLEEATAGAHAIDRAMRTLSAELAKPLGVPEIAGGSPGAAGPRGGVAALRPPHPAPAGRSAAEPRRAPGGHAGAARQASGSGAALPRGERAVLIALAQQPEGATREYLTVTTGYKRSSRDTYLQRLGAAGLWEPASDGRLRVTDAGIAALGADYEPLPTGAALREWWLARLPEGERRVLEFLIGHFPAWIDRSEIDGPCDYKRSSRDTYLQRLGVRRLVETSRGTVRAAQILFEEG